MEQVGYITFAPGGGEANSLGAFEASRDSSVDSIWKQIGFTRDYGTSPIFLADMQTFNGSDTADLRYRELQGENVSVRIEEEQSGAV